MSERELYSLRVLNRTVDKLSITKKEKVELCDKFVQEIRNSRPLT